MVHTFSDPYYGAVKGGAQLFYEPREGGATRLSRQRIQPPLHLGKSHPCDQWAISLLMSPTAGLLSGDSIDINIELASDAKAGVISPAACRVHEMAHGYAQINQTLNINSKAVLDFWPAPLILQKNSRLKQKTNLNIASDAIALLCETTIPGRVASEEFFEFDSWQSSLKIERSGKLIAFENFIVCPDSGDAADWKTVTPKGSYASLYCLCPQTLNHVVEHIHEIKIKGARIGASPLHEGGLAIKVLACDGISLRAAILSLRTALIPQLKVPFPNTLERAQTFFN